MLGETFNEDAVGRGCASHPHPMSMLGAHGTAPPLSSLGVMGRNGFCAVLFAERKRER